MADKETIAATLTTALIRSTAGRLEVLTDSQEERVKIGRQTVALYETILGMLPDPNPRK